MVQENLTPKSGEQSPKPCVLTVTVGCKPSDADAWLPGVDAVISLLRTLARTVSQAQHGVLLYGKEAGLLVVFFYFASGIFFYATFSIL